MADPRLIRRADARQLKLPKAELMRLGIRVEEDYRAAIADHQARIARFARYYRRWRNLPDTPEIGEESFSNYNVPLIQWQVAAKAAKEHAALFGDDADIEAKPIGPSDQRSAPKLSRFMSWLVFDHMRVPNKAAVFNFNKIIYGRAVVYSPWSRETYWVPLEDGTEDEQVYYEGPGFEVLHPDDWIVPAEDVESLHEFSFVMRRYRATPDELARGEDQGRYQGIAESWNDIVNLASGRKQRDFESEPIKREKDTAEGVMYEGNLSGASTIEVLEWYGKWRRLNSRRDARSDNYRMRNRYESELMIRYAPDLNRVIGVQDLAEMYPRKKNRRPFVEASLVRDGSYWSAGYGELLESHEAELTANANLATDAGEKSAGPLIFYKPATGFDPDNIEYAPNTAIATDDPAGIRVVTLTPDMNFPITKEQQVLGYAERITGISDMSMGRAIDRPNAPKTARQTLALLQEGDIRSSLELSILREDWGGILRHFYELCQEYMPEQMFFRVTEEDANGLLDSRNRGFEVHNGGAYMTSQELGGRYDFDLKFATSQFSKETKKQDQLALYQLDMQNPLIATNPRALWVRLDAVHKALGDDNFGDIVPRPPDLGLPKNPREEWSMMLQGEIVEVNPLDNDQLHILDHNRDLQREKQNPNRDEDAFRAMVAHTISHMEQLEKKKLMQALMATLAKSVAGAVDQATAQSPMQAMLGAAGGEGGAPQPGMQPGSEPGMPPGAMMPQAA